MIKVTGQATLKADFEVELDITEEQWDALSEDSQNSLLERAIDWHSALESSETDDLDVWDVEEV